MSFPDKRVPAAYFGCDAGVEVVPVVDSKIQICVECEAEERFLDRVKLWATGDRVMAFASVGVGRIQDVDDNGAKYTLLYVDDLIDLPAYPYKSFNLSPVLDCIKKIVESRFAILIAYVRPDDDLNFHPEDKVLALIADLLAKHPLLHVTVSTKGEKRIFNFYQCWACDQNPFYKINQNGGEG